MHVWLKRQDGSAAQEQFGLDTFRDLLQRVLADNQVPPPAQRSLGWGASWGSLCSSASRVAAHCQASGRLVSFHFIWQSDALLCSGMVRTWQQVAIDSLPGGSVLSQECAAVHH